MPDDTQLEAVLEDDAKSVVFDSAGSVSIDPDSKAVSYVWTLPVGAQPTVTMTTGGTKGMPLTAPSVDDTLVDRIMDRFSKMFGRKPDADALGTSFKVVGNQWLAAYSNNFKDRDGEIFPAKAIDQYVARVDKSLVPLPELWVWHGGKQTRVGQADVVARHGHFVLATGTWDANAKAQAARQFYTRHQKDTSLSHGFTYNKVAFDGVHYHDFNTFEISLLPRGVEANRFTTLEGVKAMAIDEKKKPYFFKIWGDKTDEVLQDYADAGKELEALEVEFKDFGHLDETTPDEAVSEKAMADLMADLINGQGESLKAAVATLKAVKGFEARMAEQDKVIAALKQQLDDRPRAASSDSASEMTVDRMTALVKTAAQKDPLPANSFFGFAPEES